MELLTEAQHEFQLTDDSKTLISEIKKFNNRFLKLEPDISDETTTFFKEMYDNILDAKKDFKKTSVKNFSINEVTSQTQIPKPDSFHPHFFPDEIIKSIDTIASHTMSFDYTISKRSVNVQLVFMDKNSISEIEQQYTQYVEMIYIITHLLNNYSSIECGKNLSLFIYLTDFKKKVPMSSLDEFDTKHVNTAYSDICTTNSHIVIYRNEELVKVLIHELFHNYGLDFSRVKYTSMKEKMLKLFPIKTDCELTESYAEFFGEIINIAITTYYLDDSVKMPTYIHNAHYLLFYEKLFSLIQSVKVLYKIGLEYENLYLQDEVSNTLRNNIYYNENTNVFCYYIVKNILLFNCPEFITFCNKRNLQLLDFRKTNVTLDLFYEFIKDHHNDKRFLQIIHKIEKNIQSIEHPLLKYTARISCIEMN